MTERKAVENVSEDSGFKFISVEEDEDEIVIQAGVPQGSSVPLPVEEAETAHAESFGDILEDEEAAHDGQSFEAVDEDDEEAAERARFEREKARRQARAEANRMITTEEDLKASVPFAGMQRIIIVVAIVLIVVFVLYYNFGGM